MVTLRVATPVGPISIVGEIISADDERWSVRRRDGEIAEVSVASIEARRVVPPGRSVTTSALEIEQISAFGWRPVEAARLGGWLLRASGGFTQRANSALALGDPGMALDQAIELVSEWYASRNLPALLLEPDGCAPDGLSTRLAERGWSARSETHVMTGEIAHVLRARPTALANSAASGLALEIDEAPDAAWYACAVDGGRPDSADARQVIEAHPAVVFGSLREGGRAVAAARAAVDARWAGLFMVMVAPDRRREGLGVAITLATLKEAARRGGRHVYLQVTAQNSAAIELYRQLNLRVHHSYRYWSAPAPK